MSACVCVCVCLCVFGSLEAATVKGSVFTVCPSGSGSWPLLNVTGIRGSPRVHSEGHLGSQGSEGHPGSIRFLWQPVPPRLNATHLRSSAGALLPMRGSAAWQWGRHIMQSLCQSLCCLSLSLSLLFFAKLSNRSGDWTEHWALFRGFTGGVKARAGPEVMTSWQEVDEG